MNQGVTSTTHRRFFQGRPRWRFFRTLKEQAIYGRTFKNAEEVRQAVARFVEPYNRSWRLERLGYMSPLEYRQAYLTRMAA